MLRSLGCQTFARDFAAIEALAHAPAATPHDLARNLRGVYRAIFDADLARYDAGGIRDVATDLQRGFIQLRLDLRGAIAKWQRDGLLMPEAQRALRDVFRATRYAADMLGELSIGFAPLPQGAQTYAGFSGPDSFTYIPAPPDPRESPKVRPGDVLLVRGMAHNSAAIARIGDVDSQFSHIGMIDIDDEGRAWMVEALIEDGAIINPLADALRHGLARAIIFRHPDRELAARAARFIRERIATSRRRWWSRIPYDFTMRLDSYEQLFCAKLVRQAFDVASEGRIKLATFPTRLDMKNRDFLERIGVNTVETFAPGDIELEPAFKVVAEWQDYRVTPVVRLQDLLMTKLFEWMELYGYRFEEDATIRLISRLGRVSAYMSDGAKDLIRSVVPKVPRNMSRKAISAVAMLHRTAEPILHDLLVLERKSIERGGRPLHAREVYAHMEHLRHSSGGRIGYLVAPGAR